MIDLGLALVIPPVGILVHLSMMDRRFYIVESFGPLPATYWDTWGVIAMAVSRQDISLINNTDTRQIVPLLIAVAVGVYTGEFCHFVLMLTNSHGPGQHPPAAPTDADHARFRRVRQSRAILSTLVPHSRRVWYLRVSRILFAEDD